MNALWKIQIIKVVPRKTNKLYIIFSGWGEATESVFKIAHPKNKPHMISMS